MIVKQPSIAIVIPTIGRSFLYDALLSALNQLGGIVNEIVVSVDHKSSHINLSFIDPLIARHDKNNIVKIVSSDSSGVANNLNNAIRNTSCDLISWLSDDDIYPPNKVLSQYLFLRQSMTDYQIRQRNIIVLSDFKLQYAENDTVIHSALGVYKSADIPAVGMHGLSLGAISGCSVLFSRNLWVSTGGFPSSNQFSTTQDCVFWLRCFQKTSYQYYCPKPLVISRQHENQESNILHLESSIQKASLAESIYCSFISQIESSSTLNIVDSFVGWMAIQNGMGGVTSVLSVENSDYLHSNILSIARLNMSLNKIAIVFLQLSKEDPEVNEILSIVKQTIVLKIWQFSRLNGNNFTDFVSPIIDELVELFFGEDYRTLDSLRLDFRYIFAFHRCHISHELQNRHQLVERLSSFLLSVVLPPEDMFCMLESFQSYSFEKPLFLYKSPFIASRKVLEIN